MQSYIEILSNYLAENPLITECQMSKILDKLYCCYTQHKGRDGEKIRRAFRQLDSILAQLPIVQQDAVVDVACDLCIAHQQESFRDGILVGFHLFSELS